MLSVRNYLRAYVNTGAAIKGVTCSARQLLVWRNGSHLSLTSYRMKTDGEKKRKVPKLVPTCKGKYIALRGRKLPQGVTFPSPALLWSKKNKNQSTAN